MLTVRAAMQRAVEYNSGRTAIVSGSRRLTYGEAWTRGLRLANALRSLGLKEGDRVAVLEDNRIESSDFFVATTVGGFVRVPLYRSSPREFHRHMLEITQSRAIVVDADLLHEVEGLERVVSSLEHVLVRDAEYEAWLAGFPDDDANPTLSSESPFVVRFSPGTNGPPKGVAETHHEWMSAIRDWTYMLPPIGVGDTALHIGPIAHGSGYLYTPVWFAGGVNILESSFNPSRTAAIMESERIAYMFMVPSMVAAMVRLPGVEQMDWSALKACVISVAPVPAHIARRARDVFGMRLYQLYGTTETGPAVLMGPEDWFASVPGSDPMVAIGRVMTFSELEIRGAANETLPVGADGEIAVRCEGQMTGLIGDPEATARRLVDGWVLTGDIGHIDTNGYVYISDRMEDVIVSGGVEIWSLDLERSIADDARVNEVAVVGIPDRKLGAVPLAVCVVDRIDEITSDEIIAACIARLGADRKPGRVIIQTEPLPRNAAGKVTKMAMRETYQSLAAQEAANG
jgi:acyl-CoA synthetase (AMP-forming)/AMP-acid ligase II